MDILHPSGTKVSVTEDGFVVTKPEKWPPRLILKIEPITRWVPTFNRWVVGYRLNDDGCRISQHIQWSVDWLWLNVAVEREVDI